MNNKNLILPVIILLGTMFLISGICALGFVTPTNNANINGTYIFKVSPNITNTINCTWSTSTNANFAITTNVSGNQNYFNVTNNTALLTEVASTTLTVVCRNGTGAGNSTTSSITIGIDNTAPTCSFSIDKDLVSINDVTGIETTDTSSDTTDLTYAWVLYRGDNTQSQTSASQEPTFSGTDFDQIDSFTLALTITDEVSKSTVCTNQSITVRGSDDDIVPIITSSEPGILGKDMTIPIIVGFVVFFVIILGVLLIWILSQNK